MSRLARHPTLGRGVIIGAGAKVLGNFTVGDYAKVGSNAVLLKAVPPGATAVGNPAHIIQKANAHDEARAGLFAPLAVYFSCVAISASRWSGSCRSPT